VVFWRCVFGAPALLLACAALGLLKRAARPSAAILGWATLGGGALVANWVLLFGAYRHASIGVATVVYHVQPFLLLGLGVLCFGERLRAVQLGWLALAFVGMVLIVLARPGADAGGNDYLTGIAMALGAAACYAIVAGIAKQLRTVSPYVIAAMQLTVGALLLAPLQDIALFPTSPRVWGLMIMIGVVHTGLMCMLLYRAIQQLPTPRVGALAFIYPVAAVGVDALAFGHHLQPVQWLGSAVILLAAAGINLGWFVPTPQHPAP
jgi:drug/metabolite transporter (DMT)-like permease